MTDELEKLKKAFASEEPIRAGKQARDEALGAAMTAFSEKNSPRRQGIEVPRRQKRQGNKIVELLTLSKWRKSMKLSYALAGTASFAVLAIAIANTGQLRRFVEPDPGSVIKTAEVDEKNAPQVLQQIKQAEEGEKRNDAGRKKDKEMSVVADVRPEPSPQGVLKSETAKPLMAPPAPPMAVSTPRKLVKKRKFVMGLYGGAKPQKAPVSRMMIAPGERPVVQGFNEQGRDKFDDKIPNQLKLVEKEPVSTFSIDVDTASYSFMRGAINRNSLPPKASVRIEELINYFPYDYAGPESKEAPFKANVTVMPSPWNANTKLVHIGIKGFDIKQAEKPKANLVFLLDTSGSMNAPNKLPLLINSFKLLLSSLSPDDTVSIVAYAGSAGMVLAPTKAKDKAKILGALDRLRAGGSTAGGEGIRLAYQLAESNFDKTGINRVILATDGDFNVGIRNQSELKGFVERKRKTGVFLSVLGFGRGNYNDSLMQTLAQNGNGNAAYIDNLSEARKVLVQEAGSTLFTIAKDVKIQMEFNPKTVSEYRLIGYETRMLKREDFNNDKVDAGDIGSGHTVTAIYEITPVGSQGKMVDGLRYKKKPVGSEEVTDLQSEYGFLKLRYKLPKQDKSKLISTPVSIKSALASVDAAPGDVRFATAVAGFGQILRGGKYVGKFSYDDVIKLAMSGRGADKFGYRAEFINLVRLAKSAASLQPLGLR